MVSKDIHMRYFLLLMAAVLTVYTATAQTSGQSSIRKQVEEKQFLFVAQTALPMRGRSVQLTSSYDLRVCGDSVIAYLPYYGRAYSAPMSTYDGGIKFTSVKNTFTVKDRKKSGWEITIQPADANDIRELNLTIFSNGSASLRVSSNGRDPISFTGMISRAKQQ
jgi:hypothetical protein